jgi:O-antigen/teichoic acid export membrane protein
MDASVSTSGGAPVRAADADDGRRESENERLDRNLIELLTEVRVAIPGVQVLFAFLLVLPFNQRWTSVSSFDRKLYLATLLCTALATVLLVAPTVHHRLLFQRHEKRFLVMTAHRLSQAGLATLALAVTCAIALVTHVALGGTITTAIVAAVVALCFAAVWYALPLGHRRPAKPSKPATGGAGFDR